MSVRPVAAPPAGPRSWALVLAAGDGTRLRSLTTGRGGTAVPKQFCSLNGGPSLLGLALGRAAAVAAPERTLVVVAEAHRRWWEPELAALPADNLVVQPRNSGTTAGIVLPLLRLVAREADARLLIVPSDHYFARESTLVASARRALARLDSHRRIVLLGLAADEPATGFGWIVPDGHPERGFRRVRRFVEKPDLPAARRLLRGGALWNSFLFAARAGHLLACCRRRLPELTATIEAGLAPGGSLDEAYERLEPADFSRQVLQRSPGELEVLEVPPCGWSDLGTPERVAACLRQAPRVPASERHPAAVRAPLDLGLAWLRLCAPAASAG